MEASRFENIFPKTHLKFIFNPHVSQRWLIVKTQALENYKVAFIRNKAST